MSYGSAWPGGELIDRGLADYRNGRATREALVIAVIAPRLRACGEAIAPRPTQWDDPNTMLYRLIGEHSAYNALLRLANSFLSALEREKRARPRGGGV